MELTTFEGHVLEVLSTPQHRQPIAGLQHCVTVRNQDAPVAHDRRDEDTRRDMRATELLVDQAGAFNQRDFECARLLP